MTAGLAGRGVDRLRALAPLTYTEAASLVDADRAHTLSGRVLRAHALLAIQSFDVARDQLERLQSEELEASLAARVAADLQYLCYYFGRFPDGERYFEQGRSYAAGDPILVADLYLGRSMCVIAGNDVRRAMEAARFAADALRGAPKNRATELLQCRIDIQLMHVLAQSAEYAQAAEQARAALEIARQFDTYEQCRAAYAMGYALWCWGRIQEAESALRSAEAMVRDATPPIWRWIQLCLARVTAEEEKFDDAKTFAAQSGFNAPEDYAFVALVTGGIARARALLSSFPEPHPDELPFRNAVDGLVTLHEGRPQEAIRKLENAEQRFAACGLHHYSFGCAIHAAYAHEQVVHGAGRRRVAPVLLELQRRAATGFAWYERRTASWLASAFSDDPKLHEIARAFDRRVTRSVRMPEDLVERCRRAGLTWREVEIVRGIRDRLSDGNQISRDSLAQELGITPSTLRVHLWRIREKLEVHGRGDDAIASALEGR